MNIIKSILGLSVINGMVGCATVDYIKPSDVSKFKNPAEVIVSKQLNGKDGKLTKITNDAKRFF